MKKIALAIVLIFCFLAVSGFLGDKHARFMSEKPGPAVFEEMTPSAVAEVALAEEVAKKRLAYRRELEKIVAFYENAGNQLKLEWAQRELAALDSAPRYSYIINAEVAGSSLTAADSIPEADVLYGEAVALYRKATIVGMFHSKKKLQLALNKFNELIKKYTTSDKIDDSAYLAGKIHEIYKDYSIAVLYYKRAIQWNPETPYPARYKAAKLLDYKLHERAEALQLYRESLQKESAFYNYTEITKERIQELTAEAETVEIE